MNLMLSFTSILALQKVIRSRLSAPSHRIRLIRVRHHSLAGDDTTSVRVDKKHIVTGHWDGYLSVSSFHIIKKNEFYKQYKI